MIENVIETSLDKEVYLEGKSSFLGTPLWETDSDLKYSHLSTLKKFLHRRDTPYSLGKIIELSIGEWEPPKLKVKLAQAQKEEALKAKIWISPEIMPYWDPESHGIVIEPKQSSRITEEVLLNSLKAALNYFILLNGPDEVMEITNWDLENLLSFLRGSSPELDLTYERGIELEGLLEDN